MRTLNISLLTIATIGLALSSLATPWQQRTYNTVCRNGEIKVHDLATRSECLLPREKQKDNERTCHVRIKILNSGMMNPDSYMVSNGMSIGEYGAIDFYQEDEDPTYWAAEIPEGMSDLIFDIREVKNYNIAHTIFFIKENVQINDDTELTIDPEEATMIRSFRSVKSDGNELTLPLYRATYNPDDEYVMNMELIEEGTVDNLTRKTVLCSKKLGPVSYELSLANCRTEGDVFQPEYWDYYTTDAEGYYIIEGRSYQSGPETNEIVVLIPDTPDQTIVSNDIKDFFDINIPFIEQILAGKETEYQPTSGSFPQFGMTYAGTEIGAQDWFTPSLFNAGKEQKDCNLVKASIPTHTSLTKDLEMKFTPRAMDMMVRFQQDTIWWDDTHYQIIDGSQTTLDFGRIINVTLYNIWLDGQILGAFLSTNTKLAEVCPVPPHPYLPDYAQMQGLNYNTTQPFVSGIFSAASNKNYHDFTYFDNFGAKISTYQYAQNYKLKYNGETILDSKTYDDLIDRYNALTQSLNTIRDAERYELELTTFKGDIGGVDSRTTFTAKFGGMGADETAPSLQILNFINKENEITNRFDNPSDGLIRLTGGDFELRPEGLENTDAFVKTTETITPVIEYSLYAKESWKVLKPELQDIEAEACYGDSWTVDLKDMNVRQTNSWYDLRITMTDATGNSISQVISPAFYIGDGTGIKSTYGEAQIHVKGNDIYGPYDMQVFGPDGRRYGTKGLTAGIYVVRSGKTSKKVIIR